VLKWAPRHEDVRVEVHLHALLTSVLVDLSLPVALWPWIDSASNRNEHQESYWVVKSGRRVTPTSPPSVFPLSRTCGSFDVSQPWACTASYRDSFTFSDTLLDGRGMVKFTPRPLFPGQRAAGTNWIRGWVGPTADLDTGETSLLSMLEIQRFSQSDWTVSLFTAWLYRTYYCLLRNM
jgi:hypothetical protein